MELKTTTIYVDNFRTLIARANAKNKSQNANSEKSATSNNHIRIGKLLIDAGIFDESTASQCIETSSKSKRMFGEIAVDLGLLSSETLSIALMIQKNIAKQTITADGACSWLRQIHENNQQVKPDGDSR